MALQARPLPIQLQLHAPRIWDRRPASPYAVHSPLPLPQRPARPPAPQLAPQAHRSSQAGRRQARCGGSVGCAPPPAPPPPLAHIGRRQRRPALPSPCHLAALTATHAAAVAAVPVRPSRPGARAMGAAASSEADFTAMVRACTATLLHSWFLRQLLLGGTLLRVSGTLNSLTS